MNKRAPGPGPRGPSGQPAIGHHLLDHVGNTPLLRLQRVTRDLPRGVEVYAKAEWFNPGGSVKDRPVKRIIEDAERDSRLTSDKTIIDSSSGNAGIAYAMIGAAKGYRVRLVVPENISEERRRILHAYGAEVQYSNPLEGSDGAILVARKIVEQNPGAFFYGDQYNNPSNPRAHYETTATEIFAQTKGRITHFIAGLGTSGTLVGAGRRLRELKANIEVIAGEPEGGIHGIEGLKHMATAIVPGIYDASVHDRKISIRTDSAYEMVRSLAREEGLLVGQSSGAAIVAVLEVAKTLTEGVIVAILPDAGDRYFSTATWPRMEDEEIPESLSVRTRVPTSYSERSEVVVTTRTRFQYSGSGRALELEMGHASLIVSQALAESPMECCGLLLGRRGMVTRVLPGKNIYESDRIYKMHPDQVFQAHKEAESAGEEISAIYHSHPATTAFPSATDIAEAHYPDSYYVIVSLKKPDIIDLRAFQILHGQVTEKSVILR